MKVKQIDTAIRAFAGKNPDRNIPAADLMVSVRVDGKDLAIGAEQISLGKVGRRNVVCIEGGNLDATLDVNSEIRVAARFALATLKREDASLADQRRARERLEKALGISAPSGSNPENDKDEDNDEDTKQS